MSNYENITELDFNEETGERLVEVTMSFDGETFTISMIVDDDENEFCTTDWQDEQPKSFADIATGMWDFVNLADILDYHG